MQAWQFDALKQLANGQKVHGVILADLHDEGLIRLEQSTETWLPTPEANEEFKAMARANKVQN
jgi:hypothetical protein